MAYWREKTIKGKVYQYLVESHRVDNKIRQHYVISGKFSPEQQDDIRVIYELVKQGEWRNARELCMTITDALYPEWLNDRAKWVTENSRRAEYWREEYRRPRPEADDLYARLDAIVTLLSNKKRLKQTWSRDGDSLTWQNPNSANP